MLIFESVKYQNFLISGQVPVEIVLNTRPTTLIVGTNGVGKTTISDAIAFGLFGKTLRNINKPQLVNSINGRDCLVELAFRTPQANYIIKRGIKPNIFEVYENGELIPLPAKLEDYQTMLEANILKLNYKSFKQIVVLGSDTFVPFMRLPAAQRREIIEDLLDIEIFGVMSGINRDDITVVREKLEKCNTKRNMLTEQLRMAQQFTDHLEEVRQEAIKTLEKDITTLNSTIAGLEREHAQLVEQCVSFEEVRTALIKAQKKQNEYQAMLRDMSGQQKKLVKERKFYEEHDTCPECEQPIVDDFKTAKYETLASKEESTIDAMTKCEVVIAKYDAQVEKTSTELEECQELQKQTAAIHARIALHQKRLKELQTERARHANPLESQPAVDVPALEAQAQQLQTEHDDLSRARVVVDAASMILKDNGIKTRIIKHYLPIINKQINHYLTLMDFPVNFTLDESFAEHVLSSHRQEFSYESFSSGQKKRIDIALLLAWRAVARIKNSAACNLLFLDEVFDSSLDAGGTEEVLKIIQNLERDTNVFVISHKTDQMIDKFGHTLVFELNRGFSQLKA